MRRYGSGSCSGRRSTRCSASTRPNARATTSTSVDGFRHLVALMDELYAVGWRVAGRPRQWVWSVFPSLGQAVRVARGYPPDPG